VNTIGTGPILPVQTFSPYSPLGKPAVGLESPDTKDHPLPPVEETAKAAKVENEASGQTVQTISDDPEDEQQHAKPQSALPRAEQSRTAAQPAPESSAEADSTPILPQPSLGIPMPRARSGSTENKSANGGANRKAGAYNSKTPAAPGFLLDQQV
jgi:hypothetical protein